MNQSLRFLIIILPILILIFFTRVLLIDEDTQLATFEAKNFPTFELDDLNGRPVQSESLGGIKLINVWASWCITCRVEHSFLAKLDSKDIPIIGLNYKDEAEDAINWITRFGDPYRYIIHDYKGELALDLGVTGAPETFLLSDGKIIVHYRGEVNDMIWDDVFMPIIKKESLFNAN